MKQKGTNFRALEILFHHMYLLLNILLTDWPIGVEAADHSNSVAKINSSKVSS